VGVSGAIGRNRVPVERVEEEEEEVVVVVVVVVAADDGVLRYRGMCV
jgi:hypothetical protein